MPENLPFCLIDKISQISKISQYMSKGKYSKEGKIGKQGENPWHTRGVSKSPPDKTPPDKTSPDKKPSGKSPSSKSPSGKKASGKKDSAGNTENTDKAQGEGQPSVGDIPLLLTTADTAKMLSVSSQTVLNWIEREEIPFVQLPGGGGRKRREFRIPLRGLLESLSGNYNLGRDLDATLREMGLQLPQEGDE